jgi:hypothetical protein
MIASFDRLLIAFSLSDSKLPSRDRCILYFPDVIAVFAD